MSFLAKFFLTYYCDVLFLFAVLKDRSPVLAIFLSVSILASASCQGRMVKARSGVVATDEAICSKVGKDVLVDGGHAVDAAVAAAFCLGVVCPPFSGVGGGGFMLVRQASGQAKVFDMKEMAPRQASQVVIHCHV